VSTAKRTAALFTHEAQSAQTPHSNFTLQVPQVSPQMMGHTVQGGSHTVQTPQSVASTSKTSMFAKLMGAVVLLPPENVSEFIISMSSVLVPVVQLGTVSNVMLLSASAICHLIVIGLVALAPVSMLANTLYQLPLGMAEPTWVPVVADAILPLTTLEPPLP
jgi:hypothetical protein